ncbi:hypothetical protein [Spirosoma oryzicola]|uniref:hypothetical protein n=1 Tax=Spirosoma oryzicola TaxID=2898794 RepID=UPI001E3FAD19|nr:hypothetical protein [Spirosoma oryzicola]UHG93365.1 hypothetical protein LQ777_10780 [Spirosoma oryzicola]
MREHNQYLIKVQEELSIYQKFLLNPDTDLTTTQAENFERIEAVRSWLREGFSDGQVLSRIKRIFRLQERRGREILALAYAVFAELRLSRDKDGIKAVYSEMFRQAAKNAGDMGDFKAQAALLKEAAKIDGAYDNQKEVDVESKKKPTKVTIKVKTINIGQAPAEPKKVEDIAHEVIS